MVSNLLVLLATVAFYIYGAIAVVMSLVFNWQYAKQHGFISWLLFGEIVATFKGIFWVFFI